MPESKSQNSMDPIELWRQWNETTSKMWLNTVNTSKEKVGDPYAFYRAWIKGVTDMQEQVKVNPQIVLDPREMWKLWFGATMDTWRKAAALGNDPLGLTTQWLKLMEEAQAKWASGDVLPTDPFTFFRQWYDATSEQWSKSVEEIIGSEKFLEYSRPFMESYMSLTGAFRRASEEYFKTLQLPTRSDIARVAELIVNLEEKVDTIEDAFENFEESSAKTATMESVANLETQLGNLVTRDTVAGIEKRIDQVEQKLDRVLALLEKLGTKEHSETASPAEPTHRKGHKKNTAQQED